MLIIFQYSGYSFTFGFFNYLLWLIIILNGILELNILIRLRWIKITLLTLGILGFLIYSTYFYIGYSFLKESVTRVEKWRIDNYEIVLTNRIGWAGPQYYRYDLNKYILADIFKKKMDKYYQGRELSDTCEIVFINAEVNFNKCLKKIKNEN